MQNYVEFIEPLEIVAANSSKIYVYGSGTVCIATSASSIKNKADLEDVYYAPDVHVQLLSLGKLEGQGWDICLKDGGMELWDQDGDLFAVISKVNNIYLMELTIMTPSAGIVAWMPYWKNLFMADFKKKLCRDLVDHLDEMFTDQETDVKERWTAAYELIWERIILWVIGVGNWSPGTLFPFLLEGLYPCWRSTITTCVCKPLNEKLIVCWHKVLNENPHKVINLWLVVVSEVVRFDVSPTVSKVSEVQTAIQM